MTVLTQGNIFKERIYESSILYMYKLIFKIKVELKLSESQRTILPWDIPRASAIEWTLDYQNNWEDTDKKTIWNYSSIVFGTKNKLWL